MQHFISRLEDNRTSHYGMSYNGSIAYYADEEDTAWTNPNLNSNCKSITIETSDNDNSWYVCRYYLS